MKLQAMLRSDTAAPPLPKQCRVKLSAIHGKPPQGIVVRYHEDGRAFLSEAGWARLKHRDHRIAKAALVEIRGSIDIIVTVVGVFFRGASSLGPCVEMTITTDGDTLHYTGVLWDRHLKLSTNRGSGSIHMARRLAQAMLDGTAPPIPEEEPAPEPTEPWICHMCGGSGKIDIGPCTIPRCVEQRQTHVGGTRRLCKM